MGCSKCGGGRVRSAEGKIVTGYLITYRDGTTETVKSTDLAVVRRKITLGGGGTYRAVTG